MAVPKPETVTREEMLGRLPADAAQQQSSLERLLLDRYSCRSFVERRVPRAALEEVFALAQFSANWCNAQAWQVIVTEGEGTERFRRALMEKAQVAGAGSAPDIPFPVRYEGVFRERKREAGLALYNSVGITGDRAAAARQSLENYRLFGAPHVAIITTEADLGTYGAVDCGIYLGNLMLLLQSRGIACIAQGALPRFSPMIREIFAIPENRKILCGLSFGYADEGHRANRFRTSRASTGSVLRWVCE